MNTKIHYHLKNKIKKYYHILVKDALQWKGEPIGRVRIHYDIYVKNRKTDGANVRSQIEKFVCDGMVEAGLLKDDTIDYVIGDSSAYYIDKNNPRAEITILPVTLSEATESLLRPV